MDSTSMYQGRRSRFRPVAIWLAAQTVALVGLTCWIIIDQALGRTTELGRGFGVAAVAACAAAGAGVLAWALLAGKSLARTPSLLWHGMLALVGISMSGSGAPTIGIVMIGVGIVGFVLALRVPAADPGDDE